MRTAQHRADPFDMLVDPEAALRAVEGSARLSHLTRRVCRPLDKPLIARAVSADLLAFDAELDLAELAPDCVVDGWESANP